MTTTKQPNATVTAMHEIMIKGIEVDPKTGVSTVNPNLYEQTLALTEGLTPELIKKVSDHDTNFAAASLQTVGVVGIKTIGENPELNKISADIPMGYKNNIHVSFTGKVDGPEGKEPIYGVTEAILTVRAGNNGAQSKIVRSMLGELAQAALTK